MSKYLDPIMSERGGNRFENLMEQVKDVFSSKYNDCNIKTGEKYYSAMSTFTKYIAEFTNTTKISSVQTKDIYRFAEKMRDLGMSDSTLKSDFAGIRKFYDMGTEIWGKCKVIIPSNEKIDLQDRVVGNVERAWSREEISQAKELAKSEGRLDVYHAISIAEHFGTRLDGTCSITINQIDKALDTGYLHVIEKGAKPRDIPVQVTTGAREALQEAKTWGEGKGSLWKSHIFLEDKNIRAEKKSIQDWIAHHRNSFQHSDRIASWEARENFRQTGKIEKADLCFHGIRHTWAGEKVEQLKEQGYTTEQAYKATSRWLGHERTEVSKIYVPKA